MRVLCLNTAFKNADVVLNNNGKVFCSRISASAKSSECVLPEIDKLLMNAGLGVSDLDVIAVVVGTGSFTGVRIGVSLVKGLVAVFPSIKIVAINSLDLMAYEFVKKNNPKTDFYAVQNALSGRFFVKKFNKNAEPIESENLALVYPEGLRVSLEFEGIEAEHQIDFSLENLLGFAKNKIEQNEFVSLNDLAPIYLRKSQAEENLMKRESDVKN